MTQFLPSNLLALFAPREPLKYLPPAGKLPCEKTFPPYTGVSAFLSQFEAARDVPPPTRVETKDEKRERLQKERSEQIAYKLEQDLAMWDPSSDQTIFGDPFKTLFCSRINYDTSESKLRREFDVYGPVKKVHMVVDTTSGKPRGYAFVEFEHERDMHAAYKHADGKKIDSRRILVDVERGRTVKGWRPRRLGGGLGNTRKGGSDVNTRYSGREDFVGRDRDVPDDRKGLESRDNRGPSPSERGRRRSLSRERPPPRRRSRSPRGGERPDRERDNRGERRRRGGSRERRRSPAEKVEVKKELLDENDIKTEPGLEDNKESARKRARRSRSPRASGTDRDRRRSRSRDRKRSRRSRSRDRRGGSKQRDRSRRNADGGEAGAQADGGPYIKQELENLGEYESAAAAASGFDEGDVKLGEGGIGGAAHDGENGGHYNRLEDL